MQKEYDEVLQDYLELLKRQYGGSLLGVVLFGSVARGEGRPESDMDLIVLLDSLSGDVYTESVRAVRALRAEESYRRLEAQGRHAEPYPIFWSRDEIDDHPGLLIEARDHGVVLFDPHGILAGAFRRLGERLSALGAMKVVLDDGTYYWDLKPDWRPGEVLDL